jgi:hypothetical protein
MYTISVKATKLWRGYFFKQGTHEIADILRLFFNSVGVARPDILGYCYSVHLSRPAVFHYNPHDPSVSTRC